MIDSTTPLAITEGKSPSSTAQYVGRRLAIIRKELGRLHGEQQWTQTVVAEQTGLTQNIICRLEQGEGGKVESWLTVMGLYESYGYNPAWIVTENNEHVSKLSLREPLEKLSPQQRDAALKVLDEWQQGLNESLTEIRRILMQP